MLFAKDIIRATNLRIKVANDSVEASLRSTQVKSAIEVMCEYMNAELSSLKLKIVELEKQVMYS